ncbi:MAG: hypothetical protein ABMA13_23090 [Chthoniobacteraceae bacterium]
MPVRHGSATICTVDSIDELKAKLATGWVDETDRVFDGTAWPTIAEFLHADDLRRARSSARVLNFIFALMLLAIVGGVCWGIRALKSADFSAPKRAPRVVQNDSDAYYAARNYIRNHLKAPSTAKFPAPGAGDCGARNTGTDRWHCWGWVDAQNSFGAMLRQQWQADVEYKGGGTWSAMNIRVE